MKSPAKKVFAMALVLTGLGAPVAAWAQQAAMSPSEAAASAALAAATPGATAEVEARPRVTTMSVAQTSCREFRAAAHYVETVAHQCATVGRSGAISINLGCSSVLGGVMGGLLLGGVRAMMQREWLRYRVFPSVTQRALDRYARLSARRAELLTGTGYRGEPSAAQLASREAVERELVELRAQLAWLRRMSTRIVPERLTEILAAPRLAVAPEIESAAIARIERELAREVAREAVATQSQLDVAVTGLVGVIPSSMAGFVGGAALELVLNLFAPEHVGDPSEATVSSVVAHPEVLFSASAELACRYLNAYASVRAAAAPLVAQVALAREQDAQAAELLAAAADSARIPREVLEDPRPLLPASAATEAITGRGI